MRALSLFSGSITLLFTLSLAACEPVSLGPPPANAPPSASDAETIARALDDFHDAAAKADEARYFDHFADDAVFLGTDATERWTVSAFRAYAHPHFAKGKAWSFRAARRAITIDASGSIAWFDEDLDTPNLGPARGSGVMKRIGGRWLVEQYNLAVTVPNERFDVVKKAIAAEAVRGPASAGPIEGEAPRK